MSDTGARLFEELMRFRPEGLTANGWAVKAGVSRTIWADLKRHGNPSRKTLEKLLGAAGMSLAEFEALRIGQAGWMPVAGESLADGNRGWRSAPLAPVPVLETGLAGEWGVPGGRVEIQLINRAKVVAKVDRPPALAGDAGAYAVTMAGESMWPRFRAGRQLLVSPAAAVEIGDDVLVQLFSGEVVIKELVSRLPGAIELRQFNPDVTFAVEMADVASMHKVVGEAI